MSIDVYKIREALLPGLCRKAIQDNLYRTDQMPIDIKGKTLVFTGTLSRMTRNQAKFEAMRLGARVSDSISIQTDYLVVGADPGTKVSKASRWNVQIIYEPDWYKLIGVGGNMWNAEEETKKAVKRINAYTIPARGPRIPKERLKKIPEPKVIVGFPELDLD